MASFSSSEISSMISSKKYRIKRGDSLSVLTDKFQGSFASAKCMNKSSLMDKIYNTNRSAFGKDKNIILEGKDLDLKFMCDCRCHLKIDKSKKEYIFTDEDRLVFAIKGQNYFWDDFCKCDRNIGEYMKTTFRNTPGSYLPKSMPLPMTASSSSNSNRSLMEELKKNLSGQMVTTNQIAEAFLKMTGSSYSSGQVQDLAIRLERENGTHRLSANAPCSAPRDKLEQLNCKILEEYYSIVALNSNAINDLKKGFYKVSILDKIMFAVNKDLFWNRIYQHSDDKKINEEARKGVGLSIDKLEGDKIFVATKLALGQIRVRYNPSDLKKINSRAEDKLCYIVLYYNYKYNNNQKEIVITSTSRTAREQAIIVYNNVKNNGINMSMYKGSSGQFVEQELKKGTAEHDIINMLEQGINGIPQNVNGEMKAFTGFNHVSNSNSTCDIGIRNNPWAGNDFVKVLDIFIKNSKILNSQSLPLGRGNETDAHHLVIL